MEATKIKMNMDGTIRAKVLQYKSDGNTLTDKWETLAKLADGVYYAKDRDNWDNVRYAFIFEDNGVFWYSLRAATENQFSNPKERERIINLRNNFRAYVKETAQNNGFIRSLEIEVFKRLGEDTAPLYASREAYLKNREEEERKRAEEAERRERECMEAEERRKAEVLADGKEKLLKHESITVEQIELIAEAVSYKIHIRTIGFMREKVTEAVLREDSTVTVWGRKLTSRNIDGTAKVMHELCDRLKAQAEEEVVEIKPMCETTCEERQTLDDHDYYTWLMMHEEEGSYMTIADKALAEALAWIFEAAYRKGKGHIIAMNKDGVLIETVIATAQATETPQIPTEAAETVNVSAEGENAAEAKRMAAVIEPYKDIDKYALTQHYTELLGAVCRILGISREEARERYGLFTYRQWYYLLTSITDATTQPPQSPETPQTAECTAESCKLAQAA